MLAMARETRRAERGEGSGGGEGEVERAGKEVRWRGQGVNSMPAAMAQVDFFHLYGKLFNYTNVGIAPRDKGSYYAKV